MAFSAQVETYHGGIVALPAGVRLRYLSGGARAMGGFTAASLEANGPSEALWSLLDYLGHMVMVSNKYGSKVWRGRIWSITVQERAVGVGFTLDGLANRVRVVYTARKDDGSTERRTTEFGVHLPSVDLWGEFETQVSGSELSDTAAVSLRDNTLRRRRDRQPLRGSGSGDRSVAQIEARGIFFELGQKYYEFRQGKEDFDKSGGAQHPLGYGFTSSLVLFTNAGRVRDFSGNLGGLKQGVKFTISGSAKNNGTFTVGTVDRDELVVYKSKGISFVTTDNIYDSNLGFAPLAGANHLRITGSAANSGVYTMKVYNGSNWFRVDQGTISGESAGPEVTITLPQDIKRDQEGDFNEDIGVNVSINAVGSQVAQSFQLSEAGSWPVASLAIRAQREGTHVDGIEMELCADNTGRPGTILARGIVTGDKVSDQTMDWVGVDISPQVTISSGTVYWIVVKRTGINSGKNYFLVDLDENQEYGLGNLLLWNGSAWEQRTTPADMPFRVRGAMDTTEQIDLIVTQVGQRLQGAEIEEKSGIATNQYRVGDTDGMRELQDLVDLGYAGGFRMLAQATVGDRLRVFRNNPSSVDPKYLFKVQSGVLCNRAGEPLEPGALPTGEYALLVDAPVPRVEGLNPMYIEEIEYDAESGQWYIEPNDLSAPWAIGGIDRG